MAEVGPFSSFFGADVFSFFRPVKNLMFVLFSRLAPFGIIWCHVIGILACALSFFPVRALCRRILGSEEKALLAASIWLFSPTLVSSAAWLSAINIVIMVVFAAEALVLHDSAWDNGHYCAFRTLLAGCCLFIALLSYESAVSLVPLFFLFDLYLRPGRLRKKNAISAHALFLTFSLLYLSFRFGISARTSYAGMGFVESTKWQTIASSPWFIIAHAFLWFWPFDRLFVLGSYCWGDIPIWKLIGCWVALVLASAWSLSRIRRNSVQKYCLLFFLVGFAPTSNILGFGNGPFGDYYIALASIGLAAWVADRIFMATDRKNGVFCLSVALTLAFARILGIMESSSWAAAWGNGTEVIAAGVRNHPEFFSNKIVLAMSIFGKDHYDEAIRLCDEVEKTIGSDSRHMASIFALRGEFEMEVHHNAEEALRFFDEIVRVDPSDKAKKKRYCNRGKVFELLIKDIETAEKEYGMAIEGNNPNLTAAHRLALIKDRNGKPDDAIAIWERILRIKPDDDVSLWHLAMACRKRGDERRASAFESRALKLGGH